MFKLNVIFVIIHIVIGIQLSSALEPKELKLYHSPESHLIFYGFSFENETLNYIICNRSKYESEKICKVIHKSSNFSSPSRIDSCKVRLKAETRNGVLSNQLRVVTFSNDKVILIWLEKQKFYSDLSVAQSFERLQFKLLLNIKVIDFPHCKTTDTQIVVHNKVNEVNVSILPVLTYTDSFEVIFSDTLLCESKYCRVTVDTDRSNISKPVPWFSSEYRIPYLLPITRDHPSKYFFFDANNYNAPEFMLLENDGFKMLKEFDEAASAEWEISYSVAHGNIGLCKRVQSNYNCIQFDQYGELKLEVKFSLQYKILNTVVYSLPERGFLLMTTECTSSNYWGKDNKYHITKIDTNGNINKSLEINEPRCHNHYNIMGMQFFKNNFENYCLSIVCYEDENVNLHIKCLTEKDLA